MSFSEDPIIPIEPSPSERPQEPLPPRPRRRRVTRRSMIPTDAEGQAELIASLAKRAFPSVELFVFSLLCGAVIGLGFLLDSQAVLLLGILLTPLMTPWVGFLLAILTGHGRFLFETIMALLISVALVFFGGLLAGFGARPFLPMTLTNVFIHARLWIPALVVLVIGAVTLVASFVRSEEKPFLPSVLIAYMFYLPVNAAGFGLGSGVPGIWPEGLLVFLVHFMLASVFGLITLLVLRLKPSLGGFISGLLVIIVFAGMLLWLMQPGFSSANEAPAFTPTTEPTALPSPTPSLTATPTSSPRPSSTPTKTPTPSTTTPEGTGTITATESTSTFTVSQTPTVEITLTITNTVAPTSTQAAVLGKISASEGGGANLRQTPNGKYLMTLDNGTEVEVYPDFKQVNGITWIHVFVTRDGVHYEGWLLESVVTYATPEANFGVPATSVP